MQIKYPPPPPHTQKHYKLLTLVAHEFLGEHVAALEGDVAAHRGQEALPGEGELGGGGQGHAADDGEEGEDDGRARLLAQEQRGQQHGEEGLQRLDGVREGHGHGAQADVGQRVAERVHRRQGRDPGDRLGGRLGRRVQPQRPHRRRHRRADQELERGDRQRVREGLEHLLVVTAKRERGWGLEIQISIPLLAMPA